MTNQSGNHGLLRLRKAALYVAALSLLPVGAQAARINYDLGVSVVHSDNVGFTENNETSDTILSPELSFDAVQTGSAVSFAVDGRIRYPHYLDDTFKDEIQGTLSGALDWDLVPERIRFRATNDLSRQSINVLDSFVPSNQQQVNVFTAGPTFLARLGDTTTGALELLYTNTYAEDSSDFQGNRYSLAAQVRRRLRSTDQVTFNVEALQTDYHSAGAFFDYTRYDGYVGYARSLSSIDIDLAAGYSRIEPRNYDGDSTSPLVRGNIGWRISPRSTLSAELSYEFADAAQNLVSRQDPLQATSVIESIDSGLPIGPQTYRQRRASLGYGFQSERFSLLLNPYFDRIRYLVTGTEDQDITAVRLDAAYSLQRQLQLTLAAVRQERDFSDISRNDSHTIASVALTRQMSRHWHARAYVQRWDRDSSSVGQSFIENSVGITVFYRR